jgi:hypothetical protein
MAALQDYQKQKFIGANLRLGLKQDEFMFDMSHPAFKKKEVVFSADPDKGDITGKVIPVTSIEELMRIAALPEAEKENLNKKLTFPAKAAAFAAENLYIKSGQVVTLGQAGDPSVYNFGTITVEEGGQIRVVGQVSINCQVFTQL